MSVDELWRAWHVASPSAPALNGVCGKMLPVSDNRINDIRQLSRYSKVVAFITGTTQVSSANSDDCFAALWQQCIELGDQEGVALGTVNQGAGTFYNRICAHKNLKAALLSSSRVAICIPAIDKTSTLNTSTSTLGNNGIFFDAVRANARLTLHTAVPRLTPSRSPSNALEPVPAILPAAHAAPSDVPAMLPAPSEDALLSTRYQVLVLPRFSIPNLWNAWWCPSEAFEFPMRRLFEPGGLITRYIVKPSERTKFSRYKKVVSLIQSHMPDEMCALATERCFATGWAKLSSYCALVGLLF